MDDRRYTVSNRITATNTVSIGAEVDFQAGNDITFYPGFTISGSSTGMFHAYIQDCTPPGSIQEMQEGIAVEEDASELRESRKTAKFMVYPNPANNIVNIEKAGEFSYELHSMLGALIVKGAAIERDLASIDLSSLPEGMYLLEITIDGKIFSKKIVKRAR